MDGERFDSLIKRLGTTRVTRLAALRGLAAGAVASLTGIGLFAEEADAAGKKRRRRRVCLCSTTGCQSKRVKKRARFVRRNAPCAFKGACPSVNPCAAARVGCSPANNTQGSCPAGQICNTQAICVAGCTGGPGQGSCPAGLNCVNGQCQPPGGCTPTNNTQGTCAPGQVCNIFGICVPAVGCLNVANPQCSGSQVCCPSETQRAGECRGNLQSC